VDPSRAHVDPADEKAVGAKAAELRKLPVDMDEAVVRVAVAGNKVTQVKAITTV